MFMEQKKADTGTEFSRMENVTRDNNLRKRGKGLIEEGGENLKEELKEKKKMFH